MLEPPRNPWLDIIIYVATFILFMLLVFGHHINNWVITNEFIK